MGWVASSESEFWWGSNTYKVTSHIIYNSLQQKVVFATKEDLIKWMASGDHFWMHREVVAWAACMDWELLRSRGYGILKFCFAICHSVTSKPHWHRF